MLSRVGIFLIVAGVAVFAAPRVGDDCTITEFSQVEAVINNCTNIIIRNLTVPANTTLELNLQKGSNVVFRGTTSFEYYEWKGPLMIINGSELHIRGAPGHVIHGNGELYWDGLGAKGVKKPKFIRLNVNDTTLENINVKNCPVHCISVSDCNNITISKWLIDVSDGNKFNYTGHNTDGFDVSSSNVLIKDSIVKNQDDCVVVNRGSNITVSNIECYGGHGLSVSLGFSKDNFEKNSAHNILFENSSVTFSPNGIHIKTHSDSGEGILTNLTYRNIRLEKIANFGINIQMDYENGEATGNPGTNIPIVGLKLENIIGNMLSFKDSPTMANYILCGEGACSDWEFKNIKIVLAENESYCNYVPANYTC